MPGVRIQVKSRNLSLVVHCALGLRYASTCEMMSATSVSVVLLAVEQISRHITPCISGIAACSAVRVPYSSISDSKGGRRECASLASRAEPAACVDIVGRNKADVMTHQYHPYDPLTRFRAEKHASVEHTARRCLYRIEKAAPKFFVSNGQKTLEADAVVRDTGIPRSV